MNNEMPERIWAQPSTSEVRENPWYDHGDYNGTEYIRAVDGSTYDKCLKALRAAGVTDYDNLPEE